MSKNALIATAATVPVIIVIGLIGYWLATRSTGPKYKLSPAQISAAVLDQVKDLPCGRATDRTPVAVGAWLVDDPEGNRNHARVAIKVRLADGWYLVKESPRETNYSDLDIQLVLPQGVTLVGSLLEPDPEAYDIGMGGGYILLYDANTDNTVVYDTDGYRLLVFQQGVKWTGSQPDSIGVRFNFQAFSKDRQTKPTTLEVDAEPLDK